MRKYLSITIIFMYLFSVMASSANADDTCAFGASGGDTTITPNILILLDIGGEMNEVAWHKSFKNSIDFTPPLPSGVTDAATKDVARVGVAASTGGTSSSTVTTGSVVIEQTSGTCDEIANNTDLFDGANSIKAKAAADISSGKYTLSYDSLTGTMTVGNTVTYDGCEGTIKSITVDGTTYNTAGSTYPPSSSGSGSTTCDSSTLGYTGFYNDRGYVYYNGKILPIGSDLEADETVPGITPDSTYDNPDPNNDGTIGVFTINCHTVHLPITASKVKNPNSKCVLKDCDASVMATAGEASDQAGSNSIGEFRYSKNYLNWLFFSRDMTGLPSGTVTYNGTGAFTESINAVTGVGRLPAVSRYFYAKDALFKVFRAVNNAAKFGLWRGAADVGASQVGPVKFAVTNTATGAIASDYYKINNIPGDLYSPISEMIAFAAEEYHSAAVPFSADCADNFILLVSPGISSMDDEIPSSKANSAHPDTLSNTDSQTDGGGASTPAGAITVPLDGTNVAVPVNLNGSTYADDIAYTLYDDDAAAVNKDNKTQTSNIRTVTVGFAGDTNRSAFMRSISNKGNGLTPTHPDYNDFHFEAESPDQLAAKIMEAISKILSSTNTYTAPVVPVTRTTSGNRIYMAFFKPGVTNFWEGNVVKYGLHDDLYLIDKNGTKATYDNGAMREDAVPFWDTKKWADTSASNGIHNLSRKIYTNLSGTDLTSTDNAFTLDNVNSYIGGPLTIDNGTEYTNAQIINFIRGADVRDEDRDADMDENRAVITGDVLHSEPLVVRYNDDHGDADKTNDTFKTYVFFGSNDGMLHAVKDADVAADDTETHYGDEAWAFIPKDLLSKLKYKLDDWADGQYPYFVDGSCKVFVQEVKDYQNGFLDAGRGEKAYLIFGLRMGGNYYYALDITDPESPKFLWQFPDPASPQETNMGYTWSEPEFGRVVITDSALNKETCIADGTCKDVMFVGGGFSDTSTQGTASTVKGNFVLAINVADGSLEKKFYDSANMLYSFPSNVVPADIDGDGLTDKMYVGDLGGQMWRFGKYRGNTTANGLSNINNWTSQIVVKAQNGSADTVVRRFYYPPSVTYEGKTYDMLFMGTGDRDDPCDDHLKTATPSHITDKIIAVKDDELNSPYPLYANETASTQMVNVTDIDKSSTVDIDTTHYGWYIDLISNKDTPTSASAGEKVLAKGIVFYGVYYITTFIPTTDPCVPGGDAMLYGLNYKTGNAVSEIYSAGFNQDNNRAQNLGGGIPSKPVLVITDQGAKLFFAVGSTDDSGGSIGSTGAGAVGVDPHFLKNFFELYWERYSG